MWSWILLFGAIAVLGLVVVVLAGIRLYRKVRLLLREVESLSQRAADLAGLLTQLEWTARVTRDTWESEWDDDPSIVHGAERHRDT